MMAPSISFDEAAERARAGDAEAQYALSSALYRRGEWDASLGWLRQAAAQNFVPAQLTLAAFLMDGMRYPRDLLKATRLLEPLAATEPRANLLLSELCGFAALGTGDRELGIKFLAAAARQGDGCALRQLALLSVGHQRSDLVAPLLTLAAKQGDAAALVLARAYTSGGGIMPGAVIDWPAVDDALSSLAADLPIPAAKTLSVSPLICTFPRLIDPLVLDMIMYQAAPLLQRSQIVDARTGEVRADPMRNSSHVTLSPRQHDHVLEAVERCIGRACGFSAQNGEFLQVLRYRVGEEFKPHVDYFNEAGAGANRSLADGGQRKQTALLYLNDGYGGGTTIFPRLGLTIFPRRGELLHFHNVAGNGRCHEDSLHAGMPVTTGEKWLLSQWIRSKPYPARVAW